MTELSRRRAPVLTYRVRQHELSADEIRERCAGQSHASVEATLALLERDTWTWEVLQAGGVIGTGRADTDREARGSAIAFIDLHTPEHLEAIAWALENDYIAPARALTHA